MRKFLCTSLAAGSLFIAVACSKSPSAPSVSFTAPVAAQPSNGANFKFVQQPLTLSVANAVRTSPAAATYGIEVATDPAFANIVYSKDGIAEGAGSTTSIVVDSLAGSASGPTTYYWRSKASVDGKVGAPSAPQSFVLAARVTLGAPVAVGPSANTTTSAARPTFTVQNAAVTGAPGTVSYEFQVSTASSFNTITASATVPQGGNGQTSWTPGSDLPTATLFWRVRASDPSNLVTGAFSNASSFILQPFSMKQAIILNNPPDLGSWDETAKITDIDFSGGRVVVDFDKREGPGSWPDVGFGDGGSLQYTLGMCLNINQQWYCSAAIQFWRGRDLEEGGSVDEIGLNWFYDGRWGTLAGHQPAFGELVGIFVAAGNLRDSGNVITKERSNVVLIPYGQNYRP